MFLCRDILGQSLKSVPKKRYFAPPPSAHGLSSLDETDRDYHVDCYHYEIRSRRSSWMLRVLQFNALCDHTGTQTEAVFIKSLAFVVL